MNTVKKNDYHKTKIACYMGFITQAIAANFAPLLFLKFHNDYHISLGNIALISTFFFLRLYRISYLRCCIRNICFTWTGWTGIFT